MCVRERGLREEHDRWMDGWMDGRMYGWIYIYIDR